MEKQKLVTASTKLLCELRAEQISGEIRAAANRKITANFLKGGLVASYESVRVIKHLCFVSTVVRELPLLKNFGYPLCVSGNYDQTFNL